jgi:hypothetical protein
VLVELVPLARSQLSQLHAGLTEAWRASAQHFSVADLQSIIVFLREGARVYEAQVPLLCSQVTRRAGSRTSDGRAAIRAALKAQAKAEALEKLEKTAHKLHAKADELHQRSGGL